MILLARVWLHCLVWTVAIMLPVQSVLASHCSCNHTHELAPGEAACSASRNHHQHVGCAHRRGEMREQPGNGTRSRKVNFLPCDCPPSCPCHLQHAPQVAVAAKDRESVCSEVDELPLTFVIHQPVEQVAAHCAFKCVEVSQCSSETALELCAALCRFTI